ncbi:Translocase of chloroplast 159, chloroplastic [Linum perenne]
MASNAAPDSPSRSSFSVEDDAIEKKQSVGAGIELEKKKPVYSDDDEKVVKQEEEESGETNEEKEAVVEAVRVELAEAGVAVVGSKEEEETEAVEEKEVVVDESVLPLDNEFETIAGEVEESAQLDVKKGKTDTVIDETAVLAEKGDGVELDTVVEAVHVNLLEPGVAVVGEVEGGKEESEIEAMVEEKVVESFPVDNKFDKIADADDKDLVELDKTDISLPDEKESDELDSVVEAVHVNLAEPGVAVVGEVEGSKESEIEAMVEEKVVESFPVDNKFDKIADDNEDLVKLDVNHSELETSVSANDAAKIENSGLGNEVSEVNGDVDVDDAVPKVEQVVREASVEDEVEVVKEAEEVSGETKLSEETKEANVLVGEDTVASNDRSVSVVEDLEDDQAPESKESDKTNEAMVESGLGQPVRAEAELEGEETKEANVLVGEGIAASNDRSVSVVEDLVDDQSPESKESDKTTEAEVESDLSQLARAEAELEGEDDYEDEGKTGSYEGSDDEEETEGKVFGSSEAAKQFLKELKQASSAASGEEIGFRDGQIVTDSDEEEEDEEEEDTDEEGEGKELFDSAALAALLKAASGTSSEGGDHTVTVTSQDGSQRLFSLERPAGLGSSLGAMRPASRPTPPNRSTLFGGGTPFGRGGEAIDDSSSLSEEQKKKLEDMQQMMIKYLRLVFRLGCSPEESIVSQVLYRLALVAGKKSGQIFNVDAAKRTALQLETEEGKEEDVSFSLNILVLGKSGVGKSSTVNAIFGEEKSRINAFMPATRYVNEINGVVDGIKIRVIDSPGLKSSGSEQATNRRILNSIKSYMKKCPPDIVLYVDRLDTQTRDLNDLPLLKSITTHLGSSIWRNAIVTLTHAASAPPDGPSGAPLSYDVFVAQRSHVLQQSIGQAVGDLRLMNPSLMNPVSLVENHSSCRRNRDGEKVLPNGQSWRIQLLLLCSSMKILSEATALSKSSDVGAAFDPRKLFGARTRSPPLPYMLSWLLQSRQHPKLATDESGIDEEIELADFSDSDQDDEEDEYDQLPPFKPLKKDQLAKLSKEQKAAYLEEYDYRVKLLQKKQLKEELKRMKEMKKKSATGMKPAVEDYDPENAEPAAVQVPLPDMVLPPSFDSDNPAYRYRFLEPTSQLLIRPVLDTHGWDHDPGYDGVNVENSFAVATKYPANLTVQVTKDKKDFNLHLDSSVATKHGENGSTMAGFDIQNVGKQMAYIVRGETKFKNLKKNRTTAGVSVTFLGPNIATGVKLEDQISIGKRVVLVGSTGTVRSQADSAYGANLEVRLRDADFPIGQDQSSLGLSLVKWRGDLALAANLQSQFSVGRSSKIAVRAGLNNKLSGQVSVRTSSSDQLQIALVGILPIVMSIYKSIRPPPADESYSAY